MSSESEWRRAILARFPSRPAVRATEVFDLVWAGLGVPREEVAGVLDLLHREYGIEPGFFRPDDSLDWLLEPVQAGGFWARATDEVRAGDRQLELGSYLEERCKARGVAMPRSLSTLAQFVLACAGQRAV